jgi:pullulanase/glycogen debranching enzyme
MLKSNDFLGGDELIWHRPDGAKMKDDDWQYYVRSVAASFPVHQDELFFIFNAFDKPLDYVLPEGDKNPWSLVMDTSDSVLARDKFTSVTAPAWSVLIFERKGK